MSEPDDDTVRRWQEYTRTPGAGPAGPGPTGPPEPLEPPRTPPPPPAFSARRMAAAGLALFAVLAVLAVLITWPSDPPTSSATRRPADTGSRGSGSGSAHNVVTPWVPLAGTGTIVSGVPAAAGSTPDNMVDGNLATTWRMTGNGVRRQILLELGGTFRITEVGLAVPDAGVRPILSVTWSFKDQAAVHRQSLVTTARMQRIKIPEVTASAVTLTLTEVGPAPTPVADLTSISEIEIVGR